MITPDRIIFHHIPKSGGTSVMQAIGKAINPRTSCRGAFRHDPLFGDDLIRSDFSSYFFSSHFSFHGDHYKKDQDHFLLTWVRHPVAMFYSACEYYRQDSRPSRHFQPVHLRKELQDLVTFETIYDYIDAVLEGSREKELVFPSFYFREDWERFDYIGCCETHAEDLTELGNILNLPLVPRRSNVTSQNGRRSIPVDEKFKRGYREDELCEYFQDEMREYVRACEWGERLKNLYRERVV